MNVRVQIPLVTLWQRRPTGRSRHTQNVNSVGSNPTVAIMNTYSLIWFPKRIWFPSGRFTCSPYACEPVWVKQPESIQKGYESIEIKDFTPLEQKKY